MLVAPMFGATYYVSQSTGLDTNPGTQAQPWKTLAKVNSQTFQAGDLILLMRGDTWREPLIPPSSGTSVAGITFDAYGTGPAPKITGYYVLDGGWSSAGGNIWKVNLPAWVTTMTSVSFSGLWGTPQGTPGADRQWSFSAPSLSVYPL